MTDILVGAFFFALFLGVGGNAAYELWPLLSPCVEHRPFKAGAEGLLRVEGAYCAVHRQPRIRITSPTGVLYELRIDHLLQVADYRGDLVALRAGPITVELLEGGIAHRTVAKETYSAEDFPRASDE